MRQYVFLGLTAGVGATEQPHHGERLEQPSEATAPVIHHAQIASEKACHLSDVGGGPPTVYVGFSGSSVAAEQRAGIHTGIDHVGFGPER